MAKKITKHERKLVKRNAAYRNSLSKGIDMGSGYIGGFPQFRVDKYGNARKISPGIPFINPNKHVSIYVQ